MTASLFERADVEGGLGGASKLVPSVLAIDPGPKQSGFVLWTGTQVDRAEVVPNPWLLGWLDRMPRSTIAIEMIASYGMPVGREVFETCIWIGRMVQAYHHADEVLLVPRLQVKMHVCHSARAKDSNLWAALCDRFGPPGTKAAPGTLYPLKSHTRAAFALAVTVADHLATGELNRLRSGT